MQTILITGASSGIGAQLAETFARSGVELILTGRDKARLKRVTSKCEAAGAKVMSHSLDLTNKTAAHKWFLKISKAHQIDIAIANAGIMEVCGPAGNIETYNTTERQIDTNLMAPVLIATSLIPAMQERGSGQIVLIASLAGIQPVADVPGYSASKAGLIAYGEALGNYLHGTGIVVTTIAPGFITTPMTQAHDSFRPFEISAEKAARKIMRAIEKKKSFAAFPLSLELASRSGRFLPAWLRRITNKPFNFTQS